MIKNILIIGATGTLGKFVSDKFKNSGYNVKIFSRNVKYAKTLFDDSFEFFEGDVLNKSKVDEAIANCDAVHINLKGDSEFEGTKLIVESAKEAGIKKISYISGSTVFEENRWYEMIDNKFLAEQVIKRSGINYSIFCPTWFMEGLDMMVNNGKAYMFGKQKKPFSFVSAEDYANMVVKSYQLNEADNKRFFIHGPEKILMKEALIKYCQIKYPEIKKLSSMPIPVAKMVAVLVGKESFSNAVKMFAYFDKIGELGDPTEANSILGKPSTTFDSWLSTIS